MRKKEIIFWIVAFTIGYTSLLLTSHLNFWLKMLIRVPEVYLFALAYRIFVNKDKMKTNLNKWRLKGWLHYFILVLGFVEYIVLVVAANKMDIHPGMKDIIDTISNVSIQDILFVLLISLPFYYAIVQFFFYLRIITVWVYNNKRRWFEFVLIIEDIVAVAFISLLR